MRTCEYYQELISRSLDDALSIEERKELAVHLASCPSCSQMRQLMAEISGMMEEDTEELPAGLHENIMASIRRSEMIKANRHAGAPGRHFVPKKFTITRPVRNILATAACMAVVIAAALSVNPAGRAEEVIASRNMPEAVADQVPQAAPAAAAPAPAEPTAAPAQMPVVTAEPERGITGTDTIVTTPVPTENGYLVTPTPRPTQAPEQSVIGTPIDKAAPTPVPTREPLVIETPAPTPDPVVTDAPEVVEAPAAEEPVPTEVPVILSEENEGKMSFATPEEANAAAGVPQEELPADIQKAPPVHLFSMIPSLSELISEKASVEDAGEALAAATPVPVPTDAPQPVALDLKDKELAGNLVLLLTGTLDEEGQPPEEAELPEGSWDESYILEMVFDEIPCEVTVRLYGQDVYFSLAEILIDSAALGNAGAGSALPTPSPDAVQEQNVEAGQPAGGDAAGMEEAPAEVFEPQWLLAKCGSDAFTGLLSEIIK